MRSKSLTFNTIDVETANADRASICQIGIVQVRNGKIVDTWQSLVNPEDWFDPWNVSVHGLDESDVRNSPTLPDVCSELHKRLHGSLLISHSSFDRVAFERAMPRYDLVPLQVTWLDSTKIVRRAWPEKYSRRGYGLKNVAADLGISFRHHDALEDARAAAEIVLQACAVAEMDLEDWQRSLKPPSRSSSKSKVSLQRTGNAEAGLSGESLVFTGTLSVGRKEAADKAAEAGCDVANSVTKRTTMLVVGTCDSSRLNGYSKTSKHRKAEAMIDNGAEIQILSESDFFEIVGLELVNQQ